MNRAAALGLVLALTSAAVASAQQGPAPILRTTIDPPRVVVGQKTTLRIEVLAPNYMTSPPVIPDFQVRNAVTRRLGNVNVSEQHDGTSFAGVRFEFAIYPQEIGSYALTDQKIVVRYAFAPPQTRDATLSIPPVAFEAFIPDAALQLDPFVAANRLTIDQMVQRSSEELKVGGAVTRTVTTRAEGAPAMLLPPLAFAPIDGLTLYPAQPSTQDSTDRRTDVLTATRVDAATYMLQRPGDYVLPAVTLRWWNVATGKVETARIAEVSFHVADDPAVPVAPSETSQRKWSWNTLAGFVIDRWRLSLVMLAAVLTLAWLLPRAMRVVPPWFFRRRDAFVASESWSFMHFLMTCRAGDPEKTYFALLGWLARFDPIAPSHTIAALRSAAHDRDLDEQLDSLERQLFAPPAGRPGAWSVRKLLTAIIRVRWRLMRQTSAVARPPALPQAINPVGAERVPWRPHRPVAR
jgi:hypothetical protein